MRKSKGQTIDSFYTNKDEKIKKRNNRKSKNVKERNSTRTQKTRKGKTQKSNNEDNDIINLDNEIIIGMTLKEEPKKDTKTKKVMLKSQKASQKIKK